VATLEGETQRKTKAEMMEEEEAERNVVAKCNKQAERTVRLCGSLLNAAPISGQIRSSGRQKDPPGKPDLGRLGRRRR